MLLTKEVETEISSRVKYYENIGYPIPRTKDNRGRMRVKAGEKIKVRIGDLPDGSNVLVDIKCDCCKKVLKDMKYQVYKKYVHENGDYYCQKCANNGFEKWISFYEWCYINLSKEVADEIMSRWDFELNKISPKDISFRSKGIEENGYWFKCLKCKNHKSEQKRINDFTRGCKGTIDCNQCNIIGLTHPYLIKYLINKEDALKYSMGEHVLVSTKCPNCGLEKEILVSTLVNKGLSCKKCSYGHYPEKFMFNVLEQLETVFKTQLSKTIFEWCNDFRYDFYIENEYNCIIETHGKQHYEETKSNWGRSLSETQENDKQKEELARRNGIINYIVIDCRKSDIKWIKNNIMNRDPSRSDQPCLAELLNFKENDIDWLKCHEFACDLNMVKAVCDLWGNGIKNTLEIGNTLKIHKVTVMKYLRQGNELGLCDYDGKKVSCKQVICLTTGETFDSLTDASEKYNVNISSISACCKGKPHNKSAGKHQITKEPLEWMYYDEYIKLKPILLQNAI